MYEFTGVMENRRPSDVLSNDLWSEIGASLKEQNERLRIQNDLLNSFFLM
jgi:trimethylamine:corrinoid methyltransferase-like protein